jgi:predicted small secreted protein
MLSPPASLRRIVVPQTSDTKRNLLYAGLLMLAVPVAGCNTVEGPGKDIENVGDAVEDAADEAGDEMGEDGEL